MYNSNHYTTMILPSVLCMLEIRSLFMTTYTVIPITFYWHKSMYMLLFRYSQSFDQHKYLNFSMNCSFLITSFPTSCSSLTTEEITWEYIWIILNVKKKIFLAGRQWRLLKCVAQFFLTELLQNRKSMLVVYHFHSESKCTLTLFHRVVTDVLYI